LNLSNNEINSWNDIVRIYLILKLKIKFFFIKNVLPRMNSLFILSINQNPFLSQIENYIEKLSQFCPLLEIIDDVRI